MWGELCPSLESLNITRKTQTNRGFCGTTSPFYVYSKGKHPKVLAKKNYYV
jgi:hypothetical protein